MKKFFENIAIYLLQKIDLYSLVCLKTGGSLKEMGWFKSFRLGVPVDGSGNPLPWMTYSSISFLEKRIDDGMTVFEYSCGNSTLWWGKRVKKVISCEHDKKWYERVRKMLPTNVELHQIDLEYGGAYSRKVVEYRKTFEIIIIDGRDRINCAKNCIGALKENGVIIWDNSERECYTEGLDYLTNQGYKRIDFEGMGPINIYSWSTSIFYKDNNCLNI